MDSLKHRHAHTPLCGGVVTAIFLFCFAVWGLSDAHSATDPYGAWDGSLTPAATAPFPSISPFEAEYRFGWQGLGAGEAKIQVAACDEDRRAITVRGGPNALIRKLWNYEALYAGESGGNGEMPARFHMVESYPKGALLSDAFFKEGSVSGCHRKMSETKPWENTDLPGIQDLFSAMLFVRSQPLHDGDRLRLTVFPDEAPYLVDLTVVGHDTITVIGKKIRAIRFTMRIQTIEPHGEHKGRLAPHKKFRSGRVWMSDDDRRLPLRAEVDIFVGRVFAELVKLNSQP
jgi:hypothetical protein